jgi:hypothetical protein
MEKGEKRGRCDVDDGVDGGELCAGEVGDARGSDDGVTIGLGRQVRVSENETRTGKFTYWQLADTILT